MQGVTWKLLASRQNPGNSNIGSNETQRRVMECKSGASTAGNPWNRIVQSRKSMGNCNLGWGPGSRTTKHRHKRETAIYWAYAKNARVTQRALVNHVACHVARHVARHVACIPP
eukprot:11181031-Lingulodinium_polyedra.AAC.1